jgi:hypothetical protein
MVGEHVDVVIKDLHEPAIYLQHFLAAAGGIRQRTGAQSTKQRRVSRQDAHIAIFARQLRHRNLLIHVQAVRSRNFQLKRIGHEFSPSS